MEELLRSTLVRPEVYEKTLAKQLTLVISEDNQNISAAVKIKTKKILLTIRGLIKHMKDWNYSANKGGEIPDFNLYIYQ